MPDLNIEERCPCGNHIKLSGSTVGGILTSEIQRWHRVHDKHATAIAKALAENTKWPIYYVPPLYPAPLPGAADPNPWWQNPIITFNTSTGANAGPKAEG